MLDAVIMDDFQRAVVPPAFVPPGIMRDWMSPAAQHAERFGQRILADGEAQTRAWRAKIGHLETYFSSTRDLAWSDEDLAELDTIIRIGEQQIQERVKQAKRARRKSEVTNRRLTQLDPSLAAVQKDQFERIDALNEDNIRALRELTARFREHRARVDTRRGAEPSYVHRPLTPNATTIAAMERARAGALEVVTFDDLRASILADD